MDDSSPSVPLVAPSTRPALLKFAAFLVIQLIILIVGWPLVIGFSLSIALGEGQPSQEGSWLVYAMFILELLVPVAIWLWATFKTYRNDSSRATYSVGLAIIPVLSVLLVIYQWLVG